jgi:predicted regulator of Ras-like GTPase activity (Roadblock/LC7/MglB family)
MDASEAIADLAEISSQIRTVVLVGPDGAIAGSTLPDEEAAKRFAEAAQRLLEAADEVRSGGEPLAQLEAETLDGSVFVVRDGGRVIAATTGAEPTVGLVFYDLKSCLNAVANGEADAKPARGRRTRKKAENGAA